MKKFKFTIHAEFILDENDIFDGTQLTKLVCAETARQAFFADECTVADSMYNQGLVLRPEHVTVQDVAVKRTLPVFEMCAWKFED